MMWGVRALPTASRWRTERALAALLALGAFAIPLVFTIAISDVFALPKTVAMLALSVVLALALAYLALRRGVPVLASGPA